MPKNIAELPKYRREAGKGAFLKKESPIKEEQTVEINEDYEKEITQKEFEGKAGREIEELKKIFKKPVEKPSGIARLFGTAQGLSKKIGDYFAETKQWVEFQFAKKELSKGKTKENILGSIEQNENTIGLTAFKEILEGTNEAVDSDVLEFAERNENGLANLEIKAEEAGIGEDIQDSVRKFLEALEKEAEEARNKFKEEMSDEEYEARAKEAKEILGDLYKAPSPKEKKEKVKNQPETEFDAEKYEKIKDDLDYKKRVLKDTQKYAKQTPAALKKVTGLTKEIIALEKAKKEMEKRPQWENIDTSEFEKSEEEVIGEAPFGKKVIDESHDKYLEIKDYEEENGNAPEGESAEMHLSFSYKEYQDALKNNPKKASKMEEEMYEKLAMGSVKPKSEGRREMPKGKIKISIRGET